MLQRILLTAETPLSFRSGRNVSQSETLPYIPGSAIMGALAQAHHMLGCRPEEFNQFFLQERIVYSNCYPANFKPTTLTGHDHPVLPIPVTARTCKRFPGFLFHAQEECEKCKGVTDALIPLALFALSNETCLEVLNNIEKHPQTGFPLDRIDGFFRRGAKPEYYGQPQQKTSIRTRTGINYNTGTASQSILYSRTTLSASSQFWGSWHIDDDLVEPFGKFIKEANNQGLLRVGTNRTRGFGRIALDHQELPEDSVDSVDKLQKRVEAFTALFKQEASAAQLDAPAALYVPILLTSDVILTDPLLRARLRLEPSDLAEMGITGAESLFHAAGKRQVQGWSTLWGLPKADDYAITMGSVFLFALPESTPQTFEKLLELQQQGIGIRRAEGFGQLVVAHFFHNELAKGVFR